MHTRIEIDDELINQAMQSTGLPTRSDVISLALRTLLDQSGPGPAAELTGRPAAGTEADPAELWADVDDFLSRRHRYVDFNLFAAQLGMNEMA
jgi:Arc/MetJ family transcription regulator